jgi:competence protein ComEC
MKEVPYWPCTALGFAAGIGYVYSFAGQYSLWAASAASVAAAFLCYLTFRNPRLLPLFCVCAFTAAGILRMNGEFSVWQAQSHYLTGHTGRYEVIIKEEGQKLKENGIRYKAALETVNFPEGETRKIQGTVMLYLPTQRAEFLPGSRLSVHGKIESIRFYGNPGKINLAGRYEGERILGKIFIEDISHIAYWGLSNQYQIDRWSLQCRKQVEKSFSLYMDRIRLPVLMTLIFGGSYSDIPDSVLSDFSVTGMIHILSVSGSHISLLFSFMFFIGRILGLPRNGSVFVASGLILAYGFLAGMVPPVFRAVIMGLFTAGGIFFKREGRALDFLGAAVFIMLLWNPLYLFDISFQLSAGASAGILLWARRWSLWLKQYAAMPSGIADGMAVTAASQILTVPFVLWNFHGMPLYTVIANMAAGALLEMSIIVGLLAAAVSSVSVSLAGGLVQCIDYLIYFSLWLIHAIGQWPYARIHTGGISFSGAVSYYAVLGTLLFAFKEENQFWRGTTFFIWGTVLAKVLFSFFESSSYIVLIPDLGQARAVVLLTDRACAVYYKNGQAKIDFGKKELQSFLEYYGIFSIDFLFVELQNERDPLPFSLSMPIQYAGFSSSRYPFLCATLLNSTPVRTGVVTSGQSVMLGDLKGFYDHGHWLFSVKNAGVFIDGGRGNLDNFSLPSNQRKLLWIGGTPEEGGTLDEEKIRAIDPEYAVYTGSNGVLAGENKELFILMGRKVYNPAETGAVSAVWNGKSWHISSAGIYGK